MVTRLDRLARSTRDLLNTLAQIADKGAGFRSLGDAWADTTTPHGRLMLTVLGGLAEFERELIRARTGEGRERAKARGVHMGRPPKLTPHQKKEAIKRRDAGEPTREIARMFNVSHSTISTGHSPHRHDAKHAALLSPRHAARSIRRGFAVRQWGRIGAQGRIVTEHFDSATLAAAALAQHAARKARRGYA